MEGFNNFGALISMSSPRESNSLKNGYVYGREFRDMLDSLDDEDCSEEARPPTEKKRRLSFEQVKALERSFDVDNKLEPERKLKLAQELGLQPRQVAIWFQNRRARWKAKQLEKDYDLLKANYDTLKLGFSNLEQEKAALSKELSNLKEKIGKENAQGSCDVKEELAESTHIEFRQIKLQDQCSNESQTGMNMSSLTEDRLPHGHGESIGVPMEAHNGSAQQFSYPTDSYHMNDLSPAQFSTISWFQNPRKIPQYQFVKMEDQGLLSDEPCSFFAIDEAPTLNWYPRQ